MATEMKVVVLGGGGVGKSAISVQFVSYHFVESYDPTVEDSHRKQIVVDEESVILSILDTAGQEEYSALREQYMRQGQGYIMVYSLTDESSLEEVGKQYEQLLRVHDCDQIGAVVLVANKCDLIENRKISSEQGQAFAKRLNSNMPYFEVSAKNRFNIELPFFEIIRLIRQSDPAFIALHNKKNIKSSKSSKKIRCVIF
eukprot:TRINITY_DN484_c0_g2_i3.p1 TRINITY_DN484_c0_g2~~TRINITY_DN484_c0_g2_i3.p1  ORF type:complete len:222 (-),score=71.16 TRINITY_DN484_c0_g2_i3:141-737(-)